jgi:hypothetical protein
MTGNAEEKFCYLSNWECQSPSQLLWKYLTHLSLTDTSENFMVLNTLQKSLQVVELVKTFDIIHCHITVSQVLYGWLENSK